MTCQPCFARDDCAGPSTKTCVTEFARALDRITADRGHLCPSKNPACGASIEDYSGRDMRRLCVECMGVA